MTTGKVLAAIAVSAAITFSLRAVPFLLFGGEHRMPEWLARLRERLPAAIMAVLIVYCLRGARENVTGEGLPALIAVCAVAFFYRRSHNTFVSIALGTAINMLLLRIL